MKNVFGAPLEACSTDPTDMRGSWDRAYKCSETNPQSGVHQICARIPSDFSVETGQSNWSEPRARKNANHCLCLGAYALYTAKGKKVHVKCDSVPEVALTARYIEKWGTWNGHEKDLQIRDGVKDLVRQCSKQAPNAAATQHLGQLCRQLQSQLGTHPTLAGMHSDLGCPAEERLGSSGAPNNLPFK